MALRLFEVRAAYANVVNRTHGTYDLSTDALQARAVAVLRSIASDLGLDPKVARRATKGDLIAEIRRYAEVVEAGR